MGGLRAWTAEVSRVDRRSVTVGVAVALGLLVVGVAMHTAEVWDDPFILYRYAVNLAGGAGWTFNPGRPTSDAVTSQLSVVLIAGLLWLHLSLTMASAICFCVGMWGASFCSYLTFVKLGRSRAGLIAALLVATAPPLLALRGMETAVYLALVAAGLCAAAHGKPVQAGLALAFAILARPDAIAVMAALVVWWLVRGDRRFAARALVSSAAVLMAWSVAVLHLGSRLLPSTLEAKVAQGESGDWHGYTFELLRLVFLPDSSLWSSVVLFLALVGVWVAFVQRVGIVVVLLLACVTQGIVYGLLLGVAGYPWYVALTGIAAGSVDSGCDWSGCLSGRVRGEG